MLMLLFAKSSTVVNAPFDASVGALFVVWGEYLRLWAVRHIGVISRTRSSRLGPLIVGGPYAYVRNPIYVGNLLLWAGVTCWYDPKLLPVCWLVLLPHYYLMAKWEEHLLRERHDSTFHVYARRVPGWWPYWRRHPTTLLPAAYTWRETLFSERGTLAALILGATLLAFKRFALP